LRTRELSKLQIKAEITLILEKIGSIDELSREEQVKYLTRLGSIENRQYLIEVLAKELGYSNYQRGQIISLFLQEFGTLGQLQDTLWAYIKSPDFPDEVKDIAGITLKNLGDNTDPEEFLNYLDDPKSIVDKETKKLLEVASINPEAQIDFLDFLFSLPDEEQLNLVQSLRDDYSCEYIVNVIAPALESRLASHMDEFLIDILGEARSPKAVPVLKDFIEYSNDEKLCKKAKINLNKLKLAGIDIDNVKNNNNGEQLAKISEIYECHTCIPDGMGNQAIIASRIKPNGDILMMNLIINDMHGILDCFGFYGISREDFKRIIERFQDKATRFLVFPEYCRYIIEKAEKINKKNNTAIPYEYIAWKSAIKDIKYNDYGNDTLLNKWTDKKILAESENLHKFPDFEKWFFENDDHEAIKENIEKIIDRLTENKDFYVKNVDKFKQEIENEIDKLLPIVFDPSVREVYKNRLHNVAILFNITELEHFRNIAATLAASIASDKNFDLINNSFIRGIIKRTIVEGLITYEYNLYSSEQQKLNPWNIRKAEKNRAAGYDEQQHQSIQELIEILCADERENTRA